MRIAGRGEPPPGIRRSGIHSGGQVVPGWQQRAVGDLVYADAAGTGGWYVKQVVPNEVPVLQVANVAAGRPARRDERLRWEFLWTFATKDQGNGTTRLLVRERVGFGSTAVLRADCDAVIPTAGPSPAASHARPASASTRVLPDPAGLDVVPDP